MISDSSGNYKMEEKSYNLYKKYTPECIFTDSLVFHKKYIQKQENYGIYLDLGKSGIYIYTDMHPTNFSIKIEQYQFHFIPYSYIKTYFDVIKLKYKNQVFKL